MPKPPAGVRTSHDIDGVVFHLKGRGGVVLRNADQVAQQVFLTAASALGLLLAPLITVGLGMLLGDLPMLQILNMLGIFVWMWLALQAPAWIRGALDRRIAAQPTVPVRLGPHALILPDGQRVAYSEVHTIWDDTNIELELKDGRALVPLPGVRLDHQQWLAEQLLATLERYHAGGAYDVPVQLRVLQERTQPR